MNNHKKIVSFLAKSAKFKIILIIAIIAVIFMESIYFLTSSGEVSKHIVELTEEGFEPAEISIKKGDEVEFKTLKGKPFWPASDLHPTHEIYPEFDPQAPIEADGSWIFKFNKVGEWKYHDHLWPLARGRIKVVKNLFKLKSTGQIDCKNQSENYQKIDCWQQKINLALETGMEDAFDVVGSFYTNEPLFVASCHGFVHKLGEYAYQKFASGQDLAISDKASVCGYGFYHGMMETALLSGNIKKAGNFCFEVEKKSNVLMADACFHGIGHGAITLADSSGWSDGQSLINSALKNCEEALGFGLVVKRRCASGVFMELALYSRQGKNNLKIDKDDPLYICADQDEEIKVDCYTQMNPVLTYLSGNDILAGGKYIEKIDEDRYATEAMLTLAGASLHIQNTDHSAEVSACHKLQQRLKVPCIKGLALGIVLYGVPGKEYEQAINFCDGAILSPQEKSGCFDFVFNHLSLSKLKERMRKICDMVDEEYRKGCHET